MVNLKPLHALFFFCALENVHQNTNGVHFIIQLLKIDACDSHSMRLNMKSTRHTDTDHDKNNIFRYNFPFILMDGTSIKKWIVM